jgi:hypothetical protein
MIRTRLSPIVSRPGPSSPGGSSAIPQGGTSSGWRAVTATAAAVIYSVAIPLVVEINGVHSPAEATLLVLALYAGLRFAYELTRGADRWFVLSFFAFTYVFLGIVPLVQINAHYFPWAVDAAPDSLTVAAGLCLLGVLAFDIGLWAGSTRSGIAGGSPVTPTSASTDSPAAGPAMRNRRFLSLLLGIALLSIILMASRGGLALVLASRDQMHAALCPPQSGGGLADCGFVEAFVRVPAALLAVLAIGLADVRPRSFRWLLIVAASVGVLVTANPVSAPRFWFGAVGIGLVGVTIARSPRVRLATWLLLPALLLVVFPNLDFGRYRNGNFDFSPRVDALIEKQDFDPFQQIANSVAYVGAYGTRNGQQAISSGLFFVPRSIWTDKAPATGPLVTASLGVTSNNNVSAPLWEEAYVDFGWLGVALALAGLGLIIGKVESNLRSRLLSDSAWLSVAPLLAGYGLYLLRGSLLPAAGSLAVLVGLTWVAAWMGAPRSRSTGNGQWWIDRRAADPEARGSSTRDGALKRH